MVPMLGLLLFLGGCAKSNDQGSPSPTHEAQPATGRNSGGTNGTATTLGLTAETHPAANATAHALGDAPDFTLSGTEKSADTLGSLGVNPHGHVVLPDGTIYEGETIGNLPSGQGTVADLHGTHQQGEWRDGKAYKVSGTWVAPDGTKEEGTWNFDGSPSGGTIMWPDGRVYQGSWKVVEDGVELPEGSGTMTWPDGRKYVGEFLDGKTDGQGVMHYPDGKVEDGLWKQGKFVGPAK